MEAQEEGKELIKVSVSCVPGLEFITVSECNEVFHVKSEKENRGRISFSFPVCQMHKLTTLRSVHHYWLVVSDLQDVWSASDDKDKILEKLETCVGSLPWENALYAFDYFRKNNDCTKTEAGARVQLLADKFISEASNLELDRCKNDIQSKESGSLKKVESEGQNSPPSKARKLDSYWKESSEIKFRVTCSRSGKHDFTSMEAAKYLGSGVKGKFNWNVNLEKFDIEVLAFIDDNKVTIAMKLSDESKHKRNVTCFGPTTLRATTAFCLLKLAGVKRGDIVCDPMCGTGAISLEGVCSFPFTYQIGGENHNEGCENSRKNFDNLEQTFGETKELRNFSFPQSIIQWDARRMPLRSGLVDVVVCDMPFGKRIGYKGRNFQLYPAVLNEMARICRSNGKAVLLTQHKSAMNKTLNNCKSVWKKQASFFINMGGLNVGIYVLKRFSRSNKSEEKDS